MEHSLEARMNLFSKTWGQVKEHSWLSFTVMLIDASFIVAVSFALSMFFRTISSSTVRIVLFFLKKSQGAAQQELVELVPNFATLQSMLSEIFIKASIFVIVVWLIYSFIQGIAWHLIFKIQGKKIAFWPFLGRFTIANFVVFSLAYLIIVVFGRLSVVPILENAVFTNAPVLVINLLQQGILLLVFILLAITAMLAPVLYAFLSEKQSIQSILKNLKSVITTKKAFIIGGIYGGLIAVLYLATIVQRGARILLEELLKNGAVIDFGISFMYYIFALIIVFGPLVYVAVFLINCLHKK